MLSLGTELFFAFWMASYSVGLPAGSPPPTRAATSTFLIKRANILPRRASTTAFLCFVVAHLEWPLIEYYLVFLGLSREICEPHESTWSGARSAGACRASPRGQQGGAGIDGGGAGHDQKGRRR